MVKPILGLAAVGFLGVLLWKILLMPLVAGLMGLLFFAFKIAAMIAAVWFLFWLFDKKKKDEGGTEEATPPPSA